MGEHYLVASQFAAAALMLALAAWLLALHFQSRLHRAFALFLFLRATVILVNRLPDAWPALDQAYFQRLSPYFLIGAAVSLAYFAATYPRPPARMSLRAVFLLCLGVAVVAELAYALDHCLVVCAGPGGDVVGPLVFLAAALPLVSALAALRLARQARLGGPGSSALRTVAAGFAVNAAVDAALSATVMVAAADVGAGFAGAPWRYVPHPLIALAALPLAGYLLASRSLPRRRRAATFGLVALAAATGLYVGTGEAGPRTVFLLGLWRLALPVAVTYALVRQSLFDLDARLRFTLKQSTVGAVFVGVFFVASEMGTELVSARFGGLLGIGAAVLLMFAIAPLQLMAEKLARSALPAPPPGRDLPGDMRRDIYREQVALSWADGVLDRNERLVLERLREALGLSQEEAASIELDVARRV
ncbi:MAG TPA: hypothetical protein VFH78_16245 [Candidatus Thermoplasmatota archaeon]|nr:hypothetical protein [Candidatus Thermoplasmatota archaeon]